jgi:hypothetical protein
MPRPCHATTIPFWKWLLKAMAQRGMGTAWYMWISIGRPEKACGRPARFRLLPVTTRISTNVVTWIRLAVRIFPSTTRNFTKYTAVSEHGRGAAWYVWINATGERHGICELAFSGRGTSIGEERLWFNEFPGTEPRQAVNDWPLDSVFVLAVFSTECFNATGKGAVFCSVVNCALWLRKLEMFSQGDLERPADRQQIHAALRGYLQASSKFPNQGIPHISWLQFWNVKYTVLYTVSSSYFVYHSTPSDTHQYFVSYCTCVG